MAEGSKKVEFQLKKKPQQNLNVIPEFRDHEDEHEEDSEPKKEYITFYCQEAAISSARSLAVVDESKKASLKLKKKPQQRLNVIPGFRDCNDKHKEDSKLKNALRTSYRQEEALSSDHSLAITYESKKAEFKLKEKPQQLINVIPELCDYEDEHEEDSKPKKEYITCYCQEEATSSAHSLVVDESKKATLKLKKKPQQRLNVNPGFLDCYDKHKEDSKPKKAYRTSYCQEESLSSAHSLENTANMKSQLKPKEQKFKKDGHDEDPDPLDEFITPYCEEVVMGPSTTFTMFDEYDDLFTGYDFLHYGYQRHLERVEDVTWDDDLYVCPYFLLGLCPRDLFTCTPSDLGQCLKKHNLELKERFERSTRRKSYAARFEGQLEIFCEKLLEGAKRPNLSDKELDGYQKIQEFLAQKRRETTRDDKC